MYIDSISCYCNKIPDRNNLKEMRSYFGSQFQRILANRGEESMEIRVALATEEEY